MSSLLIIFRVATGKGWTEGTSTQVLTNPPPAAIRLKILSSMRFASATSATTAVESKAGGDTVTEEVIVDKASGIP